MFKIFKYCLELHRQNITYERALEELFIMIVQKDANRQVMKVELPEDSIFHFLYTELRDLLKENEQQPANKSDNTHNGG
jgi:cobyrinic acid a,c-diamide synthase